MSDKKATKKESDVWFRMKYMGYCLANMPPDESSWELKDFYRMVRFRLAEKWNVSIKDPIFDKYERPEELVIEYFAHRVSNEEEFADEIKNISQGKPADYESTVDWMEKEAEENKKAIEEFKRKRALESGELDENAIIEDEIKEEDLDGFSFKPGDLE